MNDAPVAAIVLGARGGPRLARALASVAWARVRIVLDPAGRLAGETLPDGVLRVVAAVPPPVEQPWLFLLAEDEIVTPALAASVAAAAERKDVFVHRVRRELHGFGTAVVPAGAPIRLARREWAQVKLRAGLVPSLDVAGGRAPLLDGALVADAGDSLAGAVQDLDADATTMAVLLGAAGRGAYVLRAAPAMVAGMARVLFGRRVARPGSGTPWARWVLAVLAGYRAMVAYAKLWEHRQDEAAALR